MRPVPPILRRARYAGERGSPISIGTGKKSELGTGMLSPRGSDGTSARLRRDSRVSP
jgi:hypothetical protein